MKTIRIKNMVCPRCVATIEHTLKEMGYDLNDVEIGLVEFHEPIGIEDISKIEEAIKTLGFEILDERRSSIIERIKAQIIELVSKEVIDLTITIPEYLSSKLQMDYEILSDLFSFQETMAIEQYYVLQKIEKIKELLVYTDLTLTEIAYRMNYESIQTLTSQFKKITGLAPSDFKEIKGKKEAAILNSEF